MITMALDILPVTTDLDFDSLTVRGKLLWAPTQIEDFEAKLTYSYTTGNRPQFESSSLPYDVLENATAQVPSWSQGTHTGILDLDYALSANLSLSNKTRYSRQVIDRTVSMPGFGDGHVEQEVVSNDLLLSYDDPGSAFSGIVGLYAEQITSEDLLNFRGVSDFDDKKLRIGLYAEGTLKLGERWTLIAGVRGQQDSLERTGVSSFAVGALDFDQNR